MFSEVVEDRVRLPRLAKWVIRTKSSGSSPPIMSRKDTTCTEIRKCEVASIGSL